MSAAYQLFHLPKATQIDSSVRVTPGAKAYFFETLTTTPQDTYTTSARNVAHAHPVVADANGVFPQIYLDPSLEYKLTLNTSADVLIYTVDPVNDQILSQAVIGQFLYPQTAAELSAGVTPANYAYAPGDVRRYGAVGDNTTDCAPAFQDAFDQSAELGGADVWIPFPEIAWLLNSQINGTANRPMAIRGAGWGWTSSGVGGPAGGCIVRLSAAAGSGAACFDWDDFVMGLTITGIHFLISAESSNQRAIRCAALLQGFIYGNRFEGSGTALDTNAAIEFLDPTLVGSPYTGATSILANYITNFQRGILLRPNCTTVRIYDNTIYGNNPASASLIGVQADTDVVGAKILMNDIEGWSDCGFSDEGNINDFSHNYLESNAVSYKRANSQQPIGFGNTIISGGAPTFPAASESTIDVRTANWRVDNAYAQFGLGFRGYSRTWNEGVAQSYTPTYTGSGTLTFGTVTAQTVPSDNTKITYTTDGDETTVDFFVDGTVAGAGAEIRISLPAGAVAFGRHRSRVHTFNGGVFDNGVAEVQNNDTFIRCYFSKDAAGNWTAGAAGVYGSLKFKMSGI